MPSGPETSTTTTTHELSPEQRRLLAPVIPVAEEFMQQELQLFPGSTIAPTTPLQQEGRASLTNAARGIAGTANNAIGTNEAAAGTGGQAAAQGLNLGLQTGTAGAQGLGAILNEAGASRGSREFLQSGALLDPSTNPVLDAQIRSTIQPIQEQLQEEILPGIAGSFVGGDMFGSSRQGIAEGRAIDSFVDNATRAATDLQANNFNQGLGAMLQSSLAPLSAATEASGQAIEAGSSAMGTGADMLMRSLGLTPELGQFAFVPGATLEGVGRAEQSENTARLQEQANRFMQQQMLPMLQAQQVANLAMGLGGGSTISNSTVPGVDPFQQIFGLAMMLPFL